MKSVAFFLGLISLVAARPQGFDNVEVLEDIRDGPIEANYNNRLVLSNGVEVEESGAPGSAGQSNSQGTYTFVSPEGETFSVSFVADEGGFQPQGAHIPELPPHAIEQLRIAEQQRAEGIQFDERGFRL